MTTTVPTVAALYIDPRGPYPKMAGVDWWDEARDARLYDGPWPVVAHPPCGPWTRNAFACTLQDASLGTVAFEQVRRFGGILEQPAHSRMFVANGAPKPGERDAYGITIAVRQVDFGHVAPKPTWLYLVGCEPGPMPKPRQPTHWCRKRPGQVVSVKMCSKEQRRRTPPAFAEWLVAIARSASKAVDCVPPAKRRRRAQ